MQELYTQIARAGLQLVVFLENVDDDEVNLLNRELCRDVSLPLKHIMDVISHRTAIIHSALDMLQIRFGCPGQACAKSALSPSVSSPSLSLSPPPLSPHSNPRRRTGKSLDYLDPNIQGQASAWCVSI